MTNFSKKLLAASCAATLAASLMNLSAFAAESEMESAGGGGPSLTAPAETVKKGGKARRHARHDRRSRLGCRRHDAIPPADDCFDEDVAFSAYAPHYHTGYWEAGFNPLGALFQTLVGVPTAPLPPIAPLCISCR